MLLSSLLAGTDGFEDIGVCMELIACLRRSAYPLDVGKARIDLTRAVGHFGRWQVIAISLREPLRARPPGARLVRVKAPADVRARGDDVRRRGQIGFHRTFMPTSKRRERSRAPDATSS